jgi:hypothetical protein
MAVNYQKVWDTMNELEMITSKVSSAREILDCAIDAHENHKHEKVENLLYAVDEFLKYYLAEFDEKFKSAWKATVGDLREGDVRDNELYKAVLSEREYYEGKDDGMRPWGHSDLEYQIANAKKDKVKKWTLPTNVDGLTGEVYVNFPDDLLEAAGLKESDQIEWIDQGDGSYILKKVVKTVNMEDC